MKALLLCALRLRVLDFEDLLLRLDGALQFGGVDLGGNKVSLHALKHMAEAVLLKGLLIDLELGSVEALLKLLEATLDLEYGALSGLLLDSEAVDLLLDFLKVVLLGNHQLLHVVVLLLDLAELDGHLADLILVVLHGGGIIGRLQEGVLLNEGAGPVVQPV